MKFFPAIILILIFPVHSSNAQTNALPSLETIIQRVLDHAVVEDDNDREFNRHYTYTRIRLTEMRNAQGEVKSLEEKCTIEGVRTNSPPKIVKVAAVKPKDEPLTEAHSNIHGKVLQVKDYSLTNLVSRFQITLVGREMVNGRSSLVLDFVPRKNLPVHSYKDNFINHATGRVWVDELDYAVAKADVHLTQQVNVLGGLLGAVWKFT